MTDASPARPQVQGFHDADTGTITYLVSDPDSGRCAIIDPVLDFDPASGRTATRSAERIVDVVRTQGLTVDWILETHVHADHLTAAPWLRDQLGGTVGIGSRIGEVQAVFADIFAAEPGFARDGSQFGHLFTDGEAFTIGGLSAQALHTPGHTPACVTYQIGDALFVGDTLFMPGAGTARCDFPGGDAATLYRSIRRLLAFPGETRVFTCHDYPGPGEAPAFASTVAEQRAENIHVADSIAEADFIHRRTTRDAGLGMPRLILPSVQVNMRAGAFPPPDDQGRVFLRLPVNRF